MMGRRRKGFHRRRGTVVLGLAPREAEILGGLVGELALMVAPEQPDPDGDPLAAAVGIAPEAQPPSDPALLRLFPDAYADDADASADFRRYTEQNLRTVRHNRAERVAGVLSPLAASGDDTAVATVPDGDLGDWIGSINDLRLVLAARLGIVEDEQDVAALWDEGDPRHLHLEIYDWLTWLLSTALESLPGPGG